MGLINSAFLTILMVFVFLTVIVMYVSDLVKSGIAALKKLSSQALTYVVTKFENNIRDIKGS